MASIVPLTIQASSNQYMTGRIVFGTQSLAQAYPGNCYWAVILDRSNLNVIQNFTFTYNNNVPPQMVNYLNNPQYILILTTMNTVTPQLPVGSLYTALIQLGAGAKLKSLEQIYAALNCGTWGKFTYTLVTVMDNTPGLEFGDYSPGGGMVSTLSLVPIQIGSNTLYTPTPLS